MGRVLWHNLASPERQRMVRSRLLTGAPRLLSDMPPRMIQDYVTDLEQQIEAVKWQQTWCKCSTDTPRTTAPSLDGLSQVQICYLPDGTVVYALEINGLTAAIREDTISGIAWLECNLGVVQATWMSKSFPIWRPTKVTGEVMARHVINCVKYLVDRGVVKPKRD